MPRAMDSRTALWRMALRSAGLWERLQPRAILAENARHILDYVARGEVAAGLVYETDLRLAAGRVVAGPEIAPDLHDPILYEAVTMVDAAHPSAAAAQTQALQSCLEQLNDNNRRIIEFRYFDELKSARIAELLGRNVAAVYRALSRIHSTLRECVDNKLAAESGGLCS